MKLDKLRAQAGLYQHIAKRDLAKRYGALLITLYVCYLADVFAEALAVVVAISIGEFATLWMFRKSPSPHDLQPKHFACFLFSTVGLSVLYYIPPVLLAIQNDTAFFVYAMLWTLGSLVNTSNMYSTLPAFYWSLMIPGFVSSVLVTVAVVSVDLEPSPPLHWALAFLFLAIYIANIVHVLWQNKDTHNELAKTRAESLSRLRDLEHLNRFDKLTGILNRASFDSELADRLGAAKADHPLTVMLIDLDGFKPINDSLGHEAGDEVLKVAAKRMNAAAGDTGFAARLGGDEFGVVLPKVRDTETAIALAERVADTISQPVPYKGADLVVRASIGIARSDQTEETVEAICAAADRAMYEAKGQPLVAVALYDERRSAGRHDPKHKAKLETAIRERQIVPHYQPKYSLRTGVLHGFEALARWQDPEGETVTHAAILGDLSDQGLMEEMIFAILRQVLEDIPHLSVTAEVPQFRVSMSIPETLLASERTFQELDWLFTEHAQSAERFALEVSDRVFTARSAEIIRKRLTHYSSRGVGVVLGKFGTGYGSFRHMQEFAFDELKMDVGFAQRLGTDPSVEHIVSGFASLARALGISVSAEAVDSADQAKLLRTLGCDLALGPYFGEPLPMCEVVSRHGLGDGGRVRSKTVGL